MKSKPAQTFGLIAILLITTGFSCANPPNYAMLISGLIQIILDIVLLAVIIIGTVQEILHKKNPSKYRKRGWKKILTIPIILLLMIFKIYVLDPTLERLIPYEGVDCGEASYQFYKAQEEVIKLSEPPSQ